MHKQASARAAILTHRLLPLYYHDSAEVSLQILRALYAGGIRLVEYTNRGPFALNNFVPLRAAVQQEMPDLLLGIGTIKTPEAAESFIHAGADFVVCPSIHEGVGAMVQSAGLLWIPGCMTPTEIARAENAGADFVKIFPGHVLGYEYIAALHDLFPDLHFMVTGGVLAKENNLRNWVKAGVSAVGIGSQLISKTLAADQQFAALTQKAAQTRQLLINLYAEASQRSGQ